MTKVGPCARCFFWQWTEEVAGGDTFGECRRFPPKLIPPPEGIKDLYAASHWPETNGSDFCGEWVEGRRS
jgi:hypothetical protein